MPDRDASLATRLADGAPEAFEELLHRFGDRLFHYLLGQVRRTDIAEDLVQTVMLRLVRSRDRLAGVENLRAYIFSTAHNELIRHHSRNGHPAEREPLPADLLAAPADAPDLDAIRAAVATLSPERLEVVSLRNWQGVTFREIGDVLAISPNTAASHYRYALADLRGRMETVQGR